MLTKFEQESQILELQKEIGEITRSAYQEPVPRRGFHTLKTISEFSLVRTKLGLLEALSGPTFLDGVKRGGGLNRGD